MLHVFLVCIVLILNLSCFLSKTIFDSFSVSVDFLRLFRHHQKKLGHFVNFTLSYIEEILGLVCVVICSISFVQI